MAPVTGTIPKTKVRNNSNVPQEAVTPTRRDMSSNLVTTSLDWVPVPEYNSRGNYTQSRKTSNNASDQEYADFDNPNSFETGFGRFVPVRPQPRVLPLNTQHRDSIAAEHNDENAGPSSSYGLQPYPHPIPNGVGPHSNHTSAAVMIVNPTTPNAMSVNMSQPFNTTVNSNRKNLIRNLNKARNNFEGSSNNMTSNNNLTTSNARTGTKTVNLMNNVYDTAGSSNNLNESNQVHRESARALGDAIVAACPDANAVERRLGQIREYIRVTSSLVDTMRNSEDEAYIEHTKEEYDELVQMVMKLKESESKLERMLSVTDIESQEAIVGEQDISVIEPVIPCMYTDENNKEDIIETNPNIDSSNNSLSKKVNNIENEQMNKSLHNDQAIDKDSSLISFTGESEHDSTILSGTINLRDNDNNKQPTYQIDVQEIETVPYTELNNTSKDDNDLNETLKKNIVSCSEKLAFIEEIKCKNLEINNDNQDVIVRPISSQSMGSGYSENELWQNEMKNKMEISQQKLAALQQQQKRLLKYKAEAKQQLAEINRARQMQEMAAASHDNITNIQNPSVSCNYSVYPRLYAANQIGVATTLPHSGDINHHQSIRISQNMTTDDIIDINNRESNDLNTNASNREDRFSHRDVNLTNSEGTGAQNSESEDDDALNERARQLTMELQEIRAKKKHMESLVNEFQKIHMATHMADSRNTYSSSGEDSPDEQPSRKCNKSDPNINNDDPFKLMEIKAIKTALQKTKDLMRSVENYETEHLGEINEDNFSNIPSINDNKSEGAGSAGGWSNEGSMNRVRNSLPQRHKFTNEHHSQQQSNHELNIASLQELAQQLRMETEKIMDERARLKQVVSTKEFTRKQKKVNEEVRPSTSGIPGPVERRQMELRALLAEKQKQLEALLNKKEVLCATIEEQNVQTDTQVTSAVNQVYNGDQEQCSQSQQITIETQSASGSENFRVGGDNVYMERAHQNTQPLHSSSTYVSDSDNAIQNKSNQRSRGRRRQAHDRQCEDGFENMVSPSINMSQNTTRNEHRAEASIPNVMSPSEGENVNNTQYTNAPQQGWPNSKINQDMRTNQFTQNSHSQTMDRLLGTPQLSYPPSMPFNMVMPYGMMGGCACACGCALWAAGCWQQLVLQQRELHQLRDQINHLEERWRAENASHTLNNQVPPGNRANNYWDNFRSYSRQNLLSTNSKTNSDGHLGAGQAHNPHPLVERSHNALHHSSAGQSHVSATMATPKRNTDATAAANNVLDETRHTRRNISYDRSLSFSSAPDVLNMNQSNEHESVATGPSPGSYVQSVTRPSDEGAASNINLNRQETSNPFRNLNISNTIPEIVQSHANNLNSSDSINTKKKSSSKLPAKNSANRRLANCTLDYAQISNINIASTSEVHNPNLASTSHDVDDKATSKLFDLLKENVYTEVTALIGVNESHPDFLIQLFKELQLISSDTLRQKVLQSIRSVLSQYSSLTIHQNNDSISNEADKERTESISAASDEASNVQELDYPAPSGCMKGIIDSNIVRFLMSKSDEICTPDLLEALTSLIMDSVSNNCHPRYSKKFFLRYLSKYEGTRLQDVSSDIIDNLSDIIAENRSSDESSRRVDEAESTMLQDVAGSLSLFRSGEGQLHSCPYELWPAHVHVEIDSDASAAAVELREATRSREGAVDLINCSEIQNGELAEADQTCRVATEAEGGAGAEALPDLVEAEDATPTEAEAEWFGLDRVPTRLHMGDSPESQKNNINTQ